MARIVRIAASCAALLSCTSVKMVQREGCWVKQTERTFGGSSEELGFCTKERSEWAEDRLARLVQECIAQADFRWENRALAAWQRNEPIPPPDGDEQIARTCMSQAASALGLEVQNDALKSRLADLSHDRDDLKSATEKDRDYLHESGEKMISALGEAAKKPAPSAVATATSTGTAKTESDQRTAHQPDAPVAPPTVVVTAPPATIVTTPGAAAAPRPVVQPCPAKPKSNKLAGKAAPSCEKAAPAQDPPPADKTASRDPRKT